MQCNIYDSTDEGCHCLFINCFLRILLRSLTISMSQVQSGSISVPPEDDNFERDLQEMLEDGPSLNEITSNVQGGTPNSVSAAFAENVEPFSAGASSSQTGSSGGIYGSGSSASRLTRSYTVPPGVFAF